MTPLQLGALLDVCSGLSPDHPLRAANRDVGPVVWREALGELRRAGLIDWSDDPPMLSDKGRAYIQILCMVPFPMLSWTCPGLPAMTIGENNEFISG